MRQMGDGGTTLFDFVASQLAWRFIDAGKGCTRVEFDIDFHFKSRLLEALLAANFHAAVEKLMGCFETRAESLYGPPASAAAAG